MSKTLIIDGKIQLFSYVDNERIERVSTVALLPKQLASDWEGQSINLIDWKIDAEKQTVLVTYQIRDDLYAPIMDATLPISKIAVPIPPPNRSKNWRWNTYDSAWRNTRTGERVACL